MTATERKAWLIDRKEGIGGTDIASIAGVGYKDNDAASVYREKVAIEILDEEPNNLMLLGLATEQMNADLYLKKANVGLGWMESPGLVRCNSEPWQFATFDRILVPEDGPKRDVELKYTTFFSDEKWGDDGTDQVPERFVIQCTWQTAIAVANGATMLAPHISALAGTGDHRVYTIPFNRRLADLLLELGAEFWKRVVARQEVGPDWNHPLREKITQQLAIVNPGTWVRLGPDADALVEEYERLHFVKKQGDDAEEQIKTLKTKLRACLGENEQGMLGDGRRVKQYPVAGVHVTPKPHYRQPRVDIRILGKRR